MIIVQRESGTVTLKKDRKSNGHRTERIRYSNFEEGQTKQWSSYDVFCFSSLIKGKKINFLEFMYLFKIYCISMQVQYRGLNRSVPRYMYAQRRKPKNIVRWPLFCLSFFKKCRCHTCISDFNQLFHLSFHNWLAFLQSNYIFHVSKCQFYRILSVKLMYCV
jgi:hypothetical protein